MPVQYRAPVEDMAFVIEHVVDSQSIAKLPGHQEFTPDLIEAVLNEADKFSHEVISPLNHPCDKQGATLGPDHTVTTSPGFQQAYEQFVAAGWNGLAGNPAYGGQGLPEVLATATSEMVQSACMSFGLCPMLTAGAIHAIEHHGNPAQKQTYLPKLISGQWAGTMNLTEPQAGSDLAAITCRAQPQDDHYLLSGVKIYITYGDHDLTENIIHLVLARLPDAPAGVKGISLFIVPKYLVNDDGSLGARNDLQCLSLEHKLGIHGSPTAVMRYGDQGGAVGYLIGQPNEGLACMFTMMNHARLNVGLQGVAIAERAMQQAIWYAYDRVQGKTLIPSAHAAAPIACHPDVRRMLTSMQCRVQAMRALAYEAATCMDIAAASSDATVASQAQARVDLLIPVVKGWCTEQAQEIASIGVQVHGGMGYIEETGAAQHLRDARITTIYEGTTAIQANDFVGRKILRDEGHAIAHLLDDVAQTAAELSSNPNPGLATLGQQLNEGCAALRQSVKWMLANGKTNAAAVYFVSVPALMLAGDVLGGWLMARAALASQTPQNIQNPYSQKKLSAAITYGHLVLIRCVGQAKFIETAEHALKGALDM